MYKLYIYIPLTFFIVHREDEIQQLPPIPLEPLLPPPLLENNGRQIAQRRRRGVQGNRIIPQIPRRRGRPRGQVQLGRGRGQLVGKFTT